MNASDKNSRDTGAVNVVTTTTTTTTTESIDSVAHIGQLIQRPDSVSQNLTDISEVSIDLSKDDKEVKGQLEERTPKAAKAPNKAAKDGGIVLKDVNFTAITVKSTRGEIIKDANDGSKDISDPTKDTKDVSDPTKDTKDVSDPIKDDIKSDEESLNVAGSANQLDKNEGRHKNLLMKLVKRKKRQLFCDVPNRKTVSCLKLIIFLTVQCISLTGSFFKEIELQKQ